MKVTVLLKNDHEALKGLFNKFKRPGTRQNGKKDLFEEIRREMLIHSHMEQEVFYPALRGTSSMRSIELVSTAEKEHRAMEKLLQELGGMSVLDKNFETKMVQLMDEVVRHIAKEEEEIFDEA